VTAPALPVLPDETRPPKVRVRPAAALLDPAILRTAVWQALVKLNPRSMIRIPVMFLVEVGSVITTVEFAARPSVFVGLVTLWLWATVLFANFAEAVAEGRGKAQADTLRKARRHRDDPADVLVHGRQRRLSDLCCWPWGYASWPPGWSPGSLAREQRRV
jgi:potassium-transporting ATPase ATP-binding subunit